MAMAALSIDVITLYLANAEAQRSADAAALAAARVLSISGMTGDPNNNPAGAVNVWQQACQLATQVATAVAQQNTVAGATVPAAQITVTYPNNSDTITCSGTSPAFGVNPLVNVQVHRTNLPTFFARIWGHKGETVSAAATAEAFNSSNSETAGNGGTTLVPVQPRCVKPWIIPNIDPNNGQPFIVAANGSQQDSGVQISGTSSTGVIGETVPLSADCTPGAASGNCYPGPGGFILNNPPHAGQYVPALVSGTPVAVRSCAGAGYEAAIAGCDQTTVYACGVPASSGGTQADLTINPFNPSAAAGSTAQGATCLVSGTVGSVGGADSLDTTVYPYQIRAGSSNPLVSTGIVNNDNVITSSDSIVTVPIYNGATFVNGVTQPNVTIVGFLQLFIDNIGGATGGDIQATVLNVVGCGDGNTTPVGNPVTGSSPVPVRLIQQYP